MGAVNTTYTFTPTDTITSTKMNNIIDETVMTSQACLTGGGLEVASGQLTISQGAINSSRLAANSVTSTNIVDGTIVNADISPTAAIAGTKIAAQFGLQDMSATGDLNLGGGSSDYTVLNLQNTSGVQVHLNANGSAEGNLRTVTNHPLTISTNNTERIRISAAGNVGIGTGSPSEKFTVIGPSGGTSALFSDNVNSTLSIKHESPGNLLTYETNGSVTQRWVLNGTEKARIDSTGNVGIGKNPTTKLDVNGTVTATAFSGPLTGNVTGNASGSSGSCTGNSATATTSASCSGNSATATLATKASTLSQNGGNGTAMTFNWSGQGGQPTWLWGGNDGANHYVYNPANFSVNYANSAGTVSNGAITAAKLNGAQGGSAPVYGIRAAVNFEGRATNGNCTIRSSNNVSSVSRVAQGKYVVNFAVPMQGTGYTVVASAGTSPGSPRFACADRSTVTTGSIKIETDNISGVAADFNENNVMVIE